MIFISTHTCRFDLSVLAYLRPSRELLEFYRKRFAQQDGEHESLVDQLSSYKTVCDGQVPLNYAMIKL